MQQLLPQREALVSVQVDQRAVECPRNVLRSRHGNSDALDFVRVVVERMLFGGGEDARRPLQYEQRLGAQLAEADAVRLAVVASGRLVGRHQAKRGRRADDARLEVHLETED